MPAGSTQMTLIEGLKARAVPFHSVPLIDIAGFLDGSAKRGAAKRGERHSMRFCFDPHDDAVIACRETLGHPPKYPDVIAGEYLVGRFDDTLSYRKAEAIARAGRSARLRRKPGIAPQDRVVFRCRLCTAPSGCAGGPRPLMRRPRRGRGAKG